MWRWLLIAGFVAALVPRGTEAASSIDVDLPIQGVPYNAAPIRQNFEAAANDINALQSLNAGATAPSNPALGNLWLDTSAIPYVLKIRSSAGSQWVPVASFNNSAAQWIPPVGGGSIPSIISGATTNLGSVANAAINVTGSQSIASFGTVPEGQVKFVTFTGSATLVYNATAMILSHGRNLTMSPGQSVIATSLGSGNWRVMTLSAVDTVYQVPTNAALKQFIGAAGMRVMRAGFYAAGDGGQANYDYSSSACSLNSGAGDDGSQVQATPSGCWIADFWNKKANVRQFGAKGDNSNDDGPAFRGACAWALSAPGSSNPVYIPAGIYRFNTLDDDGGAALYLNSGLDDGKSCSLVGPDSAFDIFSMGQLDGPATIVLGDDLNRPLLRHRTQGASSHVKNLTLDGNKDNQSGWGGGPAGGRLFVVQEDDTDAGHSTPETGVIFDDAVIQNGYNGGQYIGAFRFTWGTRIWCMFSGQDTLDHCIWSRGYDSVWYLPAIGSNSGGGMLLQSGSQYQITGGAMWFNGACGLTVSGLQVNYASVWGTNLQGNDKGFCNTNEAAFASSSAGAITLTGVIFESNATRDVDVSSGPQVNRQVKLVAPTFVGCIGVGCAAPPYNISATGNIVEVSNPNFGSNGAYATDFTDTPVSVFCTGSICPSTAFTPTLGNGTPTYVTQVGYAIRNGSKVHVFASVSVSDLGGASGAMTVGNFPWAAQTLTNYAPGCALGAVVGGWTAPANYSWLTATIGSSETQAIFRKNSNTGFASDEADAAEFAASTGLSVTCDYIGSN